MSAYDRPAPDAKTLRPRTQLVHGGTARSGFGETSEALFLTQGFVYNSAEQAAARFTGEDAGFQYSRFGNPTVAMFEERMALLEGAEAARATATGMAAVTTALMGQVKAGDHVIASRALFGSCLYVVQELLPRFGVESTLVDGHDLAQWKAALRPNTKTAFLESPTNPSLSVLDIAGIAQILHAGGATLVVDNVFATPMTQKPLELGADCVVYSATKHIDGQGRCLGGVILGSKAFIEEHIQVYLRQTGPSLSPFNAWVLLKSLETLPLRIAQQQESAGRIADFLAGAAKIARVYYPGRADHPQAELARRQMKGGATMVALEVKGGREEAFRFANALEIIKISNNLGDAKSLITHPSTTTHQRMTEEARLAAGITQGMLRLSVGLEDPEDLIDDLKRGLAAV
ncbi:O-succinylhomoserine sulfhydrylase [Rhodoblastus acidophilus]|uniref:O-succinylhomoserine sulfhydrylase n=1 Tax=Rhodoblastus acidophilus TaxID=1074 RepID=A0A212RKQ1_RHOAC|nr:O-succinylhomoserine sulfhydrylase [Rhodoblastus acidophilus]MCW2315886.1 O-succinylhomoserine sulfhydrylase [Rhodoblastus acidophilus]PPQ39045.1 O-succinylhomoserine sulfhydrylase [Rhodoblastus acidophilus]RAI17018.1 O-succinylhomoserine sulfhydrylase [Rhodoblastus acidophilus]SNB73048.1 O-succinylhomoserine sulfhydrylase [Rhodoblastus acidophilus]